MIISYTDYVEIPGLPADIRELLADRASWEKLVPGLTRGGEFWHYAGQFLQFEVQLPSLDDHAPAEDTAITLHWHIKALENNSSVQITLRLYDAVVATHAVVEVIAATSTTGWPWLRRRYERAIAATARQATRRLVEMVCARQAVAHPAAVAVPAGAVAEENSSLSPMLPARNGHSNGNGRSELADRLRARYPLTVEHFEAMGALDHLARVWFLERGWDRNMRGAYDQACYSIEDLPAHAEPEFDLIYAGGGLGLLHAVVMARRYGKRVLLFDRSEVGCAHREWNISREELEAYVKLGVITWDELDTVIMREYRDGLVRFYEGPYDPYQPGRRPTDLWLPEVLNVALDANALLRLMRRKLEEAGGVILSHRFFRRVKVRRNGPPLVEVELEREGPAGAMPAEQFRGRLLMDGMGSTSPLALLRHAGQPFAGVCPTVGTVADGFAIGDGPQEYQPDLGDILISVADAQAGEQMMWEGFPGRDNEMTVYLFYYATITGREPVPEPDEPPCYSLLELFEIYFKLLHTYKQPGPHFRHVKPVYGYIPARHSLNRSEAPLLRGVLPVGDSAAQQSPLTFCGFGSHVRNLDRTTSLLDYVLRHNLLNPGDLQHINAYQVNVSLNWVFSRFMHPWDRPHDVNRLQNVFLSALNELGVDHATRFFRDRMRWSDYHPMIFGVLRRFPYILPLAFRVLGPRGVARWAGDYLRFSAAAAVATGARAAGQGVETRFSTWSERLAPRLGLRLRASYAEWRAMGWV
jgi:lycopene cyclase CruA